MPMVVNVIIPTSTINCRQKSLYVLREIRRNERFSQNFERRSTTYATCHTLSRRSLRSQTFCTLYSRNLKGTQRTLQTSSHDVEVDTSLLRIHRCPVQIVAFTKIEIDSTKSHFLNSTHFRITLDQPLRQKISTHFPS